jgi:NitT/TauT family transport system substrate-binding protein
MKRGLSMINILLLSVFLVSSTFVFIDCGPKEHRSFNIGFNEWVGFAPFYLAKEKGYFGDIDVQMHFIALEGDKRAGLYSDRLQMICETMDMFQTERDKEGYPGKIVFAVDESYGGDGVLAIEEIKEIKDLKDRVVVSEPGLPAHFVLQYLLHKEGMTLNDLELTTMTSSDAANAFIAQKADVAGTYEPYLSKALKEREGSHLLASTKDMAGYIIDVAIVTDKTLKDRRNDLEIIFKGWCKAMEYFKSNREDAVKIMAKAFNLSESEFEDTISGLRYFDYDMNQEYLGSPETKGPIFKIFDEVGVILKENNITKVTVPAKEKIDLSIVSMELD